jgi:hypothetical protein
MPALVCFKAFEQSPGIKTLNKEDFYFCRPVLFVEKSNHVIQKKANKM